MGERGRDLERLLTFVDAIVAIAITLLVLPLAEIGNAVQNGGAGELLREHTDDLLGFVLSFAVIARLWTAQHAILGTVVRQSTALVRLLLTWSLTIVFLPFPTSMAAATSNDSVAKVLYIGTMALSSAVLALIARTVSRDRSLRDTDAAPDAARATATTVTFLVALIVSVAVPATRYWPLLLLLVTDPVLDRLLRWRDARRQAAS